MLPVGRHRKSPADAWLPPRVYRGRAAFEYRPAGGGAVRLVPLTATPAEVLLEFSRLTSAARPGSVAALLDEAAASAWFAGLSPWTQRAYARAFAQLRKVFGAMATAEVRPEHVRRWLDVRAEAKSPIVANREFGALGGICRWGYERGLLRVNPCKGVRRFPEAPRARAVTPAEIETFAALCGPRLRAYLALRMAVPRSVRGNCSRCPWPLSVRRRVSRSRRRRRAACGGCSRGPRRDGSRRMRCWPSIRPRARSPGRAGAIDAPDR